MFEFSVAKCRFIDNLVLFSAKFEQPANRAFSETPQLQSQEHIQMDEERTSVQFQITQNLPPVLNIETCHTVYALLTFLAKASELLTLKTLRVHPISALNPFGQINT